MNFHVSESSAGQEQALTRVKLENLANGACFADRTVMDGTNGHVLPETETEQEIWFSRWQLLRGAELGLLWAFSRTQPDKTAGQT